MDRNTIIEQRNKLKSVHARIEQKTRNKEDTDDDWIDWLTEMNKLGDSMKAYYGEWKSAQDERDSLLNEILKD